MRGRVHANLHATAMLRRLLGVLLLAHAWFAQAAAGEAAGHAPYRSYGPADGLPSVYIQALLQDRQGFVWVGTDNGLYRYDGQRFQAFGLRDGLRSALITHLLEGRDGTLWVGTRGGLHRWNGASFASVDAPALPPTSIAALAENADGLWVVTGAAGQGPLVRDAAGRLAALPGWPGGTATALAAVAAARHAWVGAWDGSRAFVLRWEAGQWRRLELPRGGDRERIDDLLEDGRGRLWARSATGLSLASRDGEFEAVAAPLPIDAQSGILLPDPRGGLWLPTESGLLHHDGDRWQRVFGPASLPAQWCRTALVDREGSLWWGSAGLHRRLGGGVWSAYTAREGVPGDVVWAVLRDRAQRLWVATNSGAAELTASGFARVPGSEGKDLRTMAQAPDGRLFLAGRIGAEVLALDPRDRTLTALPFAGIDASARVLRLYVDREATLWAATSDGLHHTETAAASLRFARVEAVDAAGDDAFPAGLIGDVREDADGRLWVAGQHGLWMREEGRWRRFGSADGLRRDFVSHVLPTSSGELLVGYGDPLGVAFARYAGGRLHVLRHHDSDSGSADAVYLVGEDAARRYWIGGPQGIDLLAKDARRHLGLADGLVGEDVASGAFLAEADGQVWIGTSAGLARFDGTAYERAPVPPPPNVALMDLRLGAHDWPSGESVPRVAHDRNLFEARLAALSYVAAPTLEYRVRLSGLEHEAHVATNPNVRYSELPPGSYRLEAAARVAPDAPWGPESTLAFEVRPAWWQTPMFRAVLAAAAVLLLLQLLHWRTALLRRRNRQLDAQVAERTAALQVAVERLREEVGQRAAAEAALASANAEERRRTERFSLIAHIASILSSNLDADVLVLRAAQSLREVIGCEQVDIPLADACGEVRPAAPSAASAHVLDVPILLGEERLGAIRAVGSRPFDDLDAASLAIVADCLAVAIENARLFGRAQEVAIVAERQRVAHDLHDNVMQILASIRMRAQTLARQSRGQSEASTRHADRLAELARIAVAEMRSYVEQLGPDEAAEAAYVGNRRDDGAAYLHDRSLPNAVQRLLATAVPDGMRVVCDFAQFPPQAFEHEEALFRVCQEAVSNAVRHSGASTLEVSGCIVDAAARVRVSDDGCGMPDGALRRGIGLASMRRRIAALGGRVRIGAGATRGTEVEAELPRADRLAADA